MTDYRALAHRFLGEIISAPESDIQRLLHQHLTPDTVWDVSHPVNRLEGIDAVYTGLIQPLRTALAHIHRRDEIFIGGINTVDHGSQWVSAITHYVGNFMAPLMGITPHEHLIFLRSGEFYRLENGKIAEAKLIIDFLDLLRQVGRFPLPQMLGSEMLFPSPATHDGVLPGNRERGPESFTLVDAMLQDLKKFDPETFSSAGQTGEDGYWHDNMMWYGPAGIGSNFRWSGFEKDHRRAFLTAFPDRVGGNHYCRYGDGDYATVSGWPSMTMTHQEEYLGIPATGKALTLRVMDFYRCQDGKIMENWVLLDYLDLVQQIGIDLIAKAEAMR